MITGILAFAVGKLMGAAMWLSGLKFKLYVLTGNIKGILAHYKFSEGMRIGMKAKSLIPI